MTKLRLEQLRKLFGASVALDGIELEVERGEFLVVVGPSGCGKSTLLRLIAGLESPTSGEIYFDGRPISTLPPQRRDVGMVFQNYALYPHMTVAENIAFPLRVRKISKAEITLHVRQVAALLSLEGLLERFPRELSGGQQQRVAVGRALVRSPRVFLFDEPLSNLDTRLRMEMRAELAALQRRIGITTLYVTHDHTEAMTMGDRIAVLDHGRLLQVGSPAELYSDPAELFVATFLGTLPINTIAGVLDAAEGMLLFRAHDTALTLQLEPDILRRTPPSLPLNATLAIRPEHVLPSSDAHVQLTVEHVEYLGHECIVRGRVGGSVLLTMRLPPTAVLPPGTSIGVRFDPRAILLFDADGKRL
ncbi:MAG: ABC transporter ATP-binding protein [Chlorobiota bacterium]|nr:MAG: ABC transporter ATP-binding protein [Chlorobiota bacterium]